MYRFALFFVLLLPLSSFSQETNFLDMLKKDQHITLVEKDSAYEITIVPVNQPLFYKVSKIGRDFIEVEDMVGFKTIRIHVYRIKNITIIKEFKK